MAINVGDRPRDDVPLDDDPLGHCSQVIHGKARFAVAKLCPDHIAAGNGAKCDAIDAQAEDQIESCMTYFRSGPIEAGGGPLTRTLDAVSSTLER